MRSFPSITQKMDTFHLSTDLNILLDKRAK